MKTPSKESSMDKFKELNCYFCNWSILKLTDQEILKLDGLHLMCETCGHINLLKGTNFQKGESIDSLDYIFSFEDAAGI